MVRTRISIKTQDFWVLGVEFYTSSPVEVVWWWSLCLGPVVLHCALLLKLDLCAGIEEEE